MYEGFKNKKKLDNQIGSSRPNMVAKKKTFRLTP